MADLKVQRIALPARGVDQTGAVENLMQAGRGRVVRNAVFTGDGIVRPRNSITQTTGAPAAVLSGAIGSGGGIYMWNNTATGMMVNNSQCYRFNNTGAYLGTFAGLGVQAFSTAENAQIDALTWGIVAFSIGPTNRRIWTWDGSTGVALQTQAPYDALALATYANRLFVGGGSIPGTASPTYSNRIYYSIPGGPTPDVIGSWKDSVTGLVNTIVLDGDPSDAIVKLVPMNRGLYIFRQRSVYRLTGSGASNFTVVKVLNIGAQASANAFAETNTGVTFLSGAELYHFDGTSLELLSANVPSFSAQLQMTTPVAGFGLSQGSAVQVAPDQVMFCPSGSSTYCYLFNMSTGGWSEFNISGVTNNLLTRVGGNPLLVNTACGVHNLTPLRSRRASAQPDFNTTASTGSVIPFQVQSAVHRLATPTNRAQLHRIMTDYTFNQSLMTNPATLTANVYAEDGTLITSISLPSTTTNVRQRVVTDVFSEVTSIYVEFVSSTPSQPNLNGLCDIVIHDMWVEYSVAAQRRNP